MISVFFAFLGRDFLSPAGDIQNARRVPQKNVAENQLVAYFAQWGPSAFVQTSVRF